MVPSINGVGKTGHQHEKEWQHRWNNTEEYIALDTQDITDEEYSKLLNGEITIQDIQKN